MKASDSTATTLLKARLREFFGFQSGSPSDGSGSALNALGSRNPDLRARRFLLIAVLLSQLTNIATVNNTFIAAIGFAITATAFFVKEAPRQIWWRTLILIVTLAAGVAVFFSYGRFIGRDPGIALLFLFGPLKLIEAKTARDYMWVWGLGLILYVASFFENLGVSGILTLPFIIAAYITALRLFDSPKAEKNAPSLFFHAKQATTHMVLGIPLAAILFVLFPRAAAPLWGMQDPSTAQTGLSEDMQPGEIANLIKSRETAFRVEFEDGKRPPNNTLYWRGPVLGAFDGVRWSVGDRVLPGEFVRFEPDQLSRESVIYNVTAERLSTRWLPILEVPAGYPTGPAIEKTTFLTEAQQIAVRRIPSGATAYRAQSLLRPSFSAQEGLSHAFELRTGPSSMNPRTREFANALKTQYPDTADRVRAILNHFNREQFFYTLNPPAYSAEGNGPTSIDRFLFDGKRGFCEHYASATVFLLRASGVPARVVTGYQGGEWQPSGYMIVRQSDAHAWAEVLIDRQWMRIDPTAAVAPNRVEIGLADALPETERLLVNTKRWFETAQLAALWERANFSYTKWIIGFDRDRQRELLRDLGLGEMNPFTAIGWMLIAVSLSGGLIALAWWIAKRRREGKLDESVRLWHRLRQRLTKAGMPVAAHETVSNALKRASERWPAHAAHFNAFADAYNGQRFQANSDASERSSKLRDQLKALPTARLLKHARPN